MCWGEIVVIVVFVVICVGLMISNLFFIAQVQYLIFYRTDDSMREWENRR